MMKRGLGKSFASLIPTDVVDTDFDITAAEDEKVSALRLLALTDIEPNSDQPRREFNDEELAELADSIKEHGLLQPLVVAPKPGGKFEIVAGERRWRAAKIAKLTRIPVIVRKLSDQHKLELSIIENVQRKNLNPLEIATAYVKLKNQFNLTDEDIAVRVGKSISTVKNLIRLIGLPDAAKDALRQGTISEGHARQILAIDNSPKMQQKLLDEIIANKWSVRKAEQFVIGYKESGKKGVKSTTLAKRAVRTQTDLTRSLAKRLGFKSKNVVQRTNAHGGSIIIRYKDDDEIAQITKVLGL